jgi:hypothetical protein
LVGWVSLFIICSTSWMRIFDSGRAICWGVFNCCSIASSFMAGSCCLWGLKTVAWCSAKISAFCSSVLAHVLFGFLIGGMCCCGRFSFQVAFQSE